MFIKQVSVFIENVPGKLSEVTKILGENGVDISALTLADTTDFGIASLSTTPIRPAPPCGSTASS